MVLPGGRRNPYTDRAVMTASKSYLYLLLLLCSRNPASARRGGLSIIYVCLFQFSACLPNEYIVCCKGTLVLRTGYRYRCRCRYRHCTHAESNRWGNAHSACPRCLAAIRLWHGTLLGVTHVARTYQWRRFSLRDRAPEQHSGPPARGPTARGSLGTAGDRSHTSE